MTSSDKYLDGHQKEPWMANNNSTDSSRQQPVNRVHLAVGVAVLTLGIYISAFAVQILILR
jgi:hypothetical protein